MKKSRFSTNISLYLSHDTGQSYCYYFRLIGSRMISTGATFNELE